MNAIIRRINELRTQKGMTQNDLAKQIGVSANTVYHWNKTGALPTLTNIENICKVMGITLRQFFHGIEEERESDESKLLREWKMLSREEKDAVLAVMEAFKSVRRGEERK